KKLPPPAESLGGPSSRDIVPARRRAAGPRVCRVDRRGRDLVAETPTRALIIGAGPGGLTAAVALSRVGIEAKVFERTPELGRAPGGLAVQSNALRALMRLGID